MYWTIHERDCPSKAETVWSLFQSKSITTKEGACPPITNGKENKLSSHNNTLSKRWSKSTNKWRRMVNVTGTKSVLNFYNSRNTTRAKSCTKQNVDHNSCKNSWSTKIVYNGDEIKYLFSLFWNVKQSIFPILTWKNAVNWMEKSQFTFV